MTSQDSSSLPVLCYRLGVVVVFHGTCKPGSEGRRRVRNTLGFPAFSPKHLVLGCSRRRILSGTASLQKRPCCVLDFSRLRVDLNLCCR